jgi:hypothetical protein
MTPSKALMRGVTFFLLRLNSNKGTKCETGIKKSEAIL